MGKPVLVSGSESDLLTPPSQPGLVGQLHFLEASLALVCIRASGMSLQCPRAWDTLDSHRLDRPCPMGANLVLLG